MKLTIFAILLAAASGCAATQSALGALTSGPKPNQITIVNTVNPQPAAPVAPVQHHDAVASLITSGVTGAVVGGLAGAALRGSTVAIAEGVLVGAGVGTAVGLVVHEAAN